MILVTGATGTVGREVLSVLQSSGQPVRSASTDPGRAKAALEAAGLRADTGADTGADIVRLEFGDSGSYEGAFAGIDSVFLMRPPQLTNVKRDMLPALEVARAQGVRRVVFMSVQGAEKNPLVPHRRVEDYLKTSAFEVTILRPSFFMQNLSGVHAQDVRERGEIFVPAGHGRTSFIDARDIGAVAAKVLTEAGQSGKYTGKAYELTGSAALSYAEAAQIFSDVLGKRVTYADPNSLSFYRRMRSRGLPRGYILVMLALYSACRFGLAGRVTADTATLLGREPISLAQFVSDYRASFARV